MLLSVGVSKIRSTKESNPKQRTLDQIVAKVLPSTMKLKKNCVKLRVSLKDKVDLKTYYHHKQDDIQVDEKLAKIQVQNL
jgi:hypothetical protein